MNSSRCIHPKSHVILIPPVMKPTTLHTIPFCMYGLLLVMVLPSAISHGPNIRTRPRASAEWPFDVIYVWKRWWAVEWARTLRQYKQSGKRRTTPHVRYTRECGAAKAWTELLYRFISPAGQPASRPAWTGDDWRWNVLRNGETLGWQWAVVPRIYNSRLWLDWLLLYISMYKYSHMLCSIPIYVIPFYAVLWRICVYIRTWRPMVDRSLYKACFMQI